MWLTFNHKCDLEKYRNIKRTVAHTFHARVLAEINMSLTVVLSSINEGLFASRSLISISPICLEHFIIYIYI